MKRKSLLKILVLFILAGTIANAEYLKKDGEVYYEMPYLEIKLKVKGAAILGKIAKMFIFLGKN